MEKHIAVLVVINRPYRRKAFEAMNDALPDDFPLDLEIEFVTNLQDALKDLPHADWVLTELMIPECRGGDEAEYNGLTIAVAAIDARKPVIVTNGFTISGTTYDALRARGLDICVCRNASDELSPQKAWVHALYGLIYTALSIEMGLCTMTEGVIEGYPGGSGKFPLLCDERLFVPFFWNGLTDAMRDPVLRKMADMGFPRQ